MTKWAIEMAGIVKTFGAVMANDNVDFSIREGEIHALLGENGAGKSTVMSLLSGLYRADEGTIKVHGTFSSIASPKDAMKLGIGMVHQNFRLVPTLTALDNIILGERGEPWRGGGWRKRKLAQVAAICERYGLGIPLEQPIWAMSVGEQQRVEIVKTLYRGADIILLDEPTSVLTPGEAEALFQTLRELKAAGKTMIITTHKLKEVMSVADGISVMRKGRMIASLHREETDARSLAELMVGREMREAEPVLSGLTGDTILEAIGMTVRSDHGRNALEGVSFRIREGEIVGVAGVAGNGQKELAEALTGLRPWVKGDMLLRGKRMANASVRRLIDKGVAHIPEDRMKSGLAGSLGVVDNLMLKTYRSNKHFRFGLLRARANESWGKGLAERFDVRHGGLDRPVRGMSGGNQQKLLLAREIDQQPDLMVAVHPTQGLDVGAAESVHHMLLGLRDAGAGVLLISEDLDEVLRLSDRVIVLYGGRIVGELERHSADRDTIGRMMAGIEGEGVAAR
jgi:simple sugar transport system ATP-binding protein